MYRLYYINLDHRIDRKESILTMLGYTNFPKDKIFRYPAHYYRNHGALGCAQSHIGVLEDFLNSGDEFCVVLEDDFRLNNIDGFAEKIEKACSIKNLDVMMLSGNLIKHSEQNGEYVRIYDAQTTSGYIVSKKFAPIMLSNFKEAERGLIDSGTNLHDYCIDQYWKRLQISSNWLSFYPTIGYQESGFSDIEGRNVVYLSDITNHRI